MFKYVFKSISSIYKTKTFLLNYPSNKIMEKIEAPIKASITSKYDGRTKKRKWEERRSDYQSRTVEKREKLDDEKIERVKKRKYAILLGYSGSDYFGMQRNPQTRTVEEDLFKALLTLKYISEEAFDQVQQIQFQRAARTDKGVSACGQVVSIKLPEEVSICKINEHLPEAIRVFDIRRATKGFNSKSHCDARTYSYTMPSIAFCAAYNSTVSMAEWRTYRMAGSLQAVLEKTLKQYVGTKNYHNFTSKKKAEDPSAKRYIISFTTEKLTVVDDVEFIILKVKGQSFMLHQIRKMVGLCVSICRGHAPDGILGTALSSAPALSVNVPRAPGLGLVLDRVHYDRYNRRYGCDGMHAKLEWEDVADQVYKDMELFRESHILPTIVQEEVKGRPMLMWLDTLTKHRYDRQDLEDDVDPEIDQLDNENDEEQEDRP